jgi:3',5'-cyclic AMP phosphodiesterase CpdA
MKRLAWLTDIHLDLLEPDEVSAFVGSLAANPADAFLIAGDIADGPGVTARLAELADAVRRPIYFVLGNHDYYRSGIAAVRAAVEELCATREDLVWLPRAGAVALTEETCLVGHDGWGDGRLGDYWGLHVKLNDWRHIEDLRGLDDAERLERLHALGDEAAVQGAVLPGALDRFHSAVVLTHPPPFKEACWNAGRPTDLDRLPFFCGAAAGQALAEVMRGRPDRRLTVLCGHTHCRAEVEVLANLLVRVGGAEYFHPEVQGVLQIE